MKFRKDFVTNSSSSSYICEICGNNESAWDASLSELGFRDCEHGHIYCESHAMNPTVDEFINNVKAYYNNDKYMSEEDKANEISKVTEILSQYNGSLTIDKISEDVFDFENNFDEQLSCQCPICSMSNITDEDIMAYLLIKDNSTKEDIINEIKLKLFDYDTMRKYLDGSKEDESK